MESRLAELGREPIQPHDKGFPCRTLTTPVGDLARLGWNALAAETLFPLLVLKESALAHNLTTMQNYCSRNGVELAPHGKTTMAPQLFARQLEQGAWGITAATISHLRTYRDVGVQHILLATPLVDLAAARWVATELSANPDTEILCFADDALVVERLDAALRDSGFTRPIPLLVEVGYLGGRSGCRSVDDALSVGKAIRDSSELSLAGVAAFEGLLAADDRKTSVRKVDQLLDLMLNASECMDAHGLFHDSVEVILSAGGSAYFDRVVEKVGDLSLSLPVRTLLRSGCYITHDHGFYERTSPLAEGMHSTVGELLQPAIELWAMVWSRPEPSLAIVGFGKRDCAYDAELPVALAARTPVDGSPHLDAARSVRDSYAVTELNDQHAYVHIPAVDPLAPGDIVGFGISHPCTAFDKWRLIPVVDDDYWVIDAVRTLF